MSTRHRGPPRETRALDAFIKLSRAHNTVAGEIQKDFAEAGLTEGQFGVLESLYHLGPMNQREIGRKLLCSSANVSTVLDNLERDGYVHRERSEEDRRAVIVSLSPEGRRLIQRLFPVHAARIARIFAALSADEQEQLAALCKKLGTSLGR